MTDAEETAGRPDGGSVETSRRIRSLDAFYYYQGLIGQIEIALSKQQSRVLMISSALDGEGTTEVVLGLGLTLSGGMGRPTAIVDCNTTNPDVHRRFGVDDVGLDEYLKGVLTLDQALLNTTVPNLHVMALGKGLTSLAAIKEEKFAAFISALRQRFDYVLMDSPAIGVNPEATLLCDKADAVVIVVKHGSTKREVARRTKELVERAGGRVLGVVLNKRKFPVPEFLYRRL
jgi:capsular exopolysaccharide synthesis family protein